MRVKAGERFERVRGSSPEEAKFFWTGGPLRVAEKTWFQSSFSGSTAFETDEGLLLVDAGQALLAPAMAAQLRQQTQAPIHTALYTHGHADHAYGLRSFLIDGQAPPRVIGHRNMPARFARYEATQRHNAYVNARQFGGGSEGAEDNPAFNIFRRPEILPDTLYDEQLEIEVGGLGFQLHYCRGETDDHTWLYCPERGVLCPGDLFIWGVPNAGNPQKAQRYPWDWARGLREMAECGARTLCPGHGGPVVDEPERIRDMLKETAGYLESIVDQTLAALENGSPPHVDIVRSVQPPDSDSPWLQPVYDEAEFIVRNIIRFYGGWWNGRPSDLKPAPRDALAREIAQLAGGCARLLERARQLAAAGDLQLACHLADYALESAPGDPEVQSAVVELYEQRAAGESSLMAENLFYSAASYAKAGRPFS